MTPKSAKQPPLLTIQDTSWQPGRPVKPEETTKRDLNFIKANWNSICPCFAAVKLDGIRAQLHWNGSRGWLFSRNLKDWTIRYPQVVNALKYQIRADQAVLDGELLAVDPVTKKIVPREYVLRSKWQHHRVVVFDLLYLNGQVWMDQPIEARIEKMQQILEPIEPYILYPADEVEIHAFEDLRSFYDQCIDDGHEGIIIKPLGSLYRPGTRARHRIKVKETDTIDAVILGYDVSTDAQAVVGAQSYLIGVYDQEKQQFVAIAKAVQGELSNREWKSLYKKVSRLKVSERPDRVLTKERPDAWVQPEIVAEVNGYGRRPSTKHIAGLDQTGIAWELSESRFSKRGIRVDKGPEDATSVGQFLAIRLAPGHDAVEGSESGLHQLGLL